MVEAQGAYRRDMTVPEGHRVAMQALQTGRASGPQTFYRHLLMDRGIHVAGPGEEKPRRPQGLRQERSGGKLRITGGDVTDPARWKEQMRRSGLIGSGVREKLGKELRR